jgi:hypothetical protein
MLQDMTKTWNGTHSFNTTFEGYYNWYLECSGLIQNTAVKKIHKLDIGTLETMTTAYSNPEIQNSS